MGRGLLPLPVDRDHFINRRTPRLIFLDWCCLVPPFNVARHASKGSSVFQRPRHGPQVPASDPARSCVVHFGDLVHNNFGRKPFVEELYN